MPDICPVTADFAARAAWINRHAWLAGIDLDTECRQAEDEGRDLRSVRRAIGRLKAAPAPEGAWSTVLGGKRDAAWVAAYYALNDRIQALPSRAGHPWVEPDDLAGIRAARPPAVPLKPWRGSRREFARRLHGGLLGRICGCMLGKPVEGWPRDSIRISNEETGNWPVANYMRLPSRPEDARIAARRPASKWSLANGPGTCLRPGIRGGVEDDDINYTTTGFAIVKRWGAGFTPSDVASFWLDNLPVNHTCTAERVAYRNLVAGLPPPSSATHRNPYREWIGAQIRADYFGFANPGLPERAAEWAWRDASISHVRNGIYGEMWVAAMLAAAYVHDDWVTILRAGLAQVPARSRLAQSVERVIGDCLRGLDYDGAVAALHARWNERVGHHWCHTLSNAEVVAIGLLYGEEDFGRSVGRAVMCGFDTDCNGATVGGLWGVKHGVDAIPSRWASPMRDRVCTGVAGYHETAISALAADMVGTALRCRRG
ncbi:MAG: ADP-ribosylglycohydrolase [Lentisphaerae bacterium ADurb.BinA184]|nr:MAG: ADP-ribosylglycohydrolase [Lentisphaerae bacterium ADurb.BinA184]